MCTCARAPGEVSHPGLSDRESGQVVSGHSRHVQPGIRAVSQSTPGIRSVLGRASGLCSSHIWAFGLRFLRYRVPKPCPAGQPPCVGGFLRYPTASHFLDLACPVGAGAPLQASIRGHPSRDSHSTDPVRHPVHRDKTGTNSRITWRMTA